MDKLPVRCFSCGGVRHHGLARDWLQCLQACEPREAWRRAQQLQSRPLLDCCKVIVLTSMPTLASERAEMWRGAE